MIPEVYIEQWRQNTKWINPAQVEQDLIISRALIDLYNNSHIRDTLIFRGGTALNKLFLKPPSRYSEDIDFVQKSASPIGQTLDTIRAILEPWLGSPKWKVTQRSAKMIYKYETINKLTAKLKIEINTTEHLQVLPLCRKEYEMQSNWWSGNTKITTYDIDELIATKLRALYQRRKGRDLFDLWYVTKNDLINLDRVFDVLTKYSKKYKSNFTRDEFLANLLLKREHQAFQSDMNALLPTGLKWDFDEAYQFVLEQIINKMP